MVGCLGSKESIHIDGNLIRKYHRDSIIDLDTVGRTRPVQSVTGNEAAILTRGVRAARLGEALEVEFLPFLVNYQIT